MLVPPNVDVGVGFLVKDNNNITKPLGCFFVEDSNGEKVPLKGNGSYEGTCNVKWKPEMLGMHTIIAKADDVNRFFETDEENNAREEQYEVHPKPLSDVYIEDIRNLSPSTSIYPGDLVKVIATIRNKGSAPTPTGIRVCVGFWVNNVKLGNYTVKDSNGQPKSLGIKESYTGICDVEWQPNAAGTYLIKAKADEDNLFKEADENNNTYEEYFQVYDKPLPDLIISSVSISPTSPNLGESVNVYATVANIGDADAGGFRVEIKSDNGYLGHFNVDSLIKGKSLKWYCDNKWLITYGDFKLTAYADCDGKIKEKRENNNSRSASYSWVDLPDLKVLNIYLDPPQFSLGALIKVIATIKNDGLVPTYYDRDIKVKFQMESQYLGEFVLKNFLGSGEYFFAECSSTITGFLGKRMIQAVVDPDNIIPETNENNNSKQEEFEGVVEPPPNF